MPKRLIIVWCKVREYLWGPKCVDGRKTKNNY